MRVYEGVAAAYFGALALVAVVRGRPGERLRVAGLSTALVVVVAAVAFHGSDALRAWAPLVYLVAGYWLPAMSAPAPQHPTRFEQWLRASDAALRPRSTTLPGFLHHAVELAYLLCYPLVPLSLAVVWTTGTRSDVTRFWTAVLAAGYACYASLPWLISRPPRLAGDVAAPARRTSAVNAFVLGRVSHQLNTFPSGHVAVSLASAASVAFVEPLAGGLVGIMALAIAVGAVAGRYHYVVDVLFGVVVGAIAAVIAAI